MIEDFVKIRKGTHIKTAFKKTMKIIWQNILEESKDFKLQEGMVIQIIIRK